MEKWILLHYLACLRFDINSYIQFDYRRLIREKSNLKITKLKINMQNIVSDFCKHASLVKGCLLKAQLQNISDSYFKISIQDQFSLFQYLSYSSIGTF